MSIRNVEIQTIGLHVGTPDHSKALPLQRRYTKSGINLNGYQLLDGQTITEYFGVDVKNFNKLSEVKQQQVVQAQNTAIEQILSGVNETTGDTITKEQAIANVQAIAKSDVIGDVNPNEFNTRDAKYNAAIETQSNNMLSKVPPKVQGLSVFDFEEFDICII